MARIEVTENALLEALRAAVMESDEGALTTVEIAETLGISSQMAGLRIRKLAKAGQIECVRKMCVDMTGTSRPQPAYRMRA